MEQPSKNTSDPSRNPFTSISGKEKSAWKHPYGTDVYHTSSDVTLFSASLPVIRHEKFNFEKSEQNYQYHDDNFPSLSKGIREDKFKDPVEEIDPIFLPGDEDELFAGIIDDFDLIKLPTQLEDLDDDFFGSGGGLEIESENQENLINGSSNFSTSDGNNNLSCVSHFGSANGAGTVSGEHPYGEHPSRTLFVRNINSNVEDSELKSLFEQFGDIRTLYTLCKHRGFVMISYYDIRAARMAMRGLQNKPLRRRKLDIHFSIPKDNPTEKDVNQGTLVVFNLDSSVSNDDLLQIFGAYGEVKEIRETPHKRHHKFIEFYDVRAADSALKALNRVDIAGKRIKLEPSRPGGARRSIMQQLAQETDQDDILNFRHHIGSPIANSPPGIWANFGSPVEGNSLHGHHSLSPNFGTNHSLSPNFGTNHSPNFGTNHSPNFGTNHSPNFGTNHSPNFGTNHSPNFGINHSPNFGTNHSPNFGTNHSPGLASILPSLGSNSNPVKIAPIGKDPRRINQAISNANSTQLSSSSPLSDSNPSSIGTLSGPQFLWGSPTVQSEKTNSASSNWSSSLNRGQFNFPYSTRHGPFLGSHPLVGSAPSVGQVKGHFGFFPESPKLFANHPVNIGFGSPRNGAYYFDNGSFGGVYDSSRVRRGENVNQMENKRQYQLDLEKILNGEDNRTTLMIKNIPNKYTSKMLLAAIDETHKGTYDFLYLPIDFKNKCNVGYAFINMVSPSHIVSFYEAFNGKRWEKFNSEKVASLAYGRIQGKLGLISHFQNSSLMNEDKRCRPIVFQSEGQGTDDLESFPSGNLNIFIRQPDGSYAGDSLDSPKGDLSDKQYMF